MNTISEKVTEATLLRGRVRLLQPETGFHAGLDTVFLAAAVPPVAGRGTAQVLDAGCGVGSAGLCLLARLGGKAAALIGIDVQQDLVDLAHQNAALNGMADRCRFFQGNILNDRQVADNAFDVVMMNPPYQEGGTHMPSPRPGKAVAHGEEGAGAALADWVKYAHKKLKNGGRLVMVHRADRLDDIVLHLTKRKWFGSLEIIPLWPRAGADAKRILLRARKERHAPLTLRPGIVLHEKNGSYTPGAEAVLSDMGAV